jgi:hypothetical protein
MTNSDVEVVVAHKGRDWFKTDRDIRYSLGDLKGAPLPVHFFLNSYTDRNQTCFPGEKLIGRKCEYSRVWVSHAVQRLSRHEYIDILEYGKRGKDGKRNTSSTYLVRWFPPPWEDKTFSWLKTDGEIRDHLGELKGCPLSVFTCIATYMNGAQWAKVSVSEIVHWTGYSVRPVKYAIDFLEELECVRVVEKSVGHIPTKFEVLKYFTYGGEGVIAQAKAINQRIFEAKARIEQLDDITREKARRRLGSLGDLPNVPEGVGNV